MQSDALQQCQTDHLLSTDSGYHVQTLRVATGVSEQEGVQVQITRLLVESYYDIVRRSLQDSVPKAIMHFLVLFVQRGLQQHLIRSLYRSHTLSC